MKADPFYFEIKDMITQFVSAFDGIVIKRFNKDREIKDRIQVKYVYAPKQRVLHDLVNKAKHMTLPVVAVHMSGVTRDTTRVFNKLDSSYYLSTEAQTLTGNIGTEDKIPQPVPINININMSIMTKFQTDMDQILSNFIPYSNPYVIISWPVPGRFAGLPQEIRSEVLWNDSVSISYPIELSPETPYRVSADTAFTIKGWLFRKATSPVKTIFAVNTNTVAIDTLDDLPGIDTPEDFKLFNNLFESTS